MLKFVELKAVTTRPDGTEPAEIYIDRAKVPGGWLVRTISDGIAMAFVPDPTHEWDGRR